MQNRPRVVHVMSGMSKGGGIEVGVRTLIERGFYNGVDLHVIALTQGNKFTYDDLVKNLGADHVTILLRREKVRHRDLPYLVYGLDREFRRINPVTAVLSAPSSILYGRLAAGFHPDMKVITFEHNTEKLSLPDKFITRLTSRRSDAMFGDTQETLTFMAQSYGKRIPSYEVPLVIAEPSSPREAANVPRIFNLFSLGRLEKQKNYDQLIKAVALLSHEGRGIDLVIAGEGSLRRELEYLATDHGVGDRVHLVGFRSDKQSLFDKAHIYVQPSRYEGVCMATIEAMAAGVPVVAANFAGARDYGVDGKNMVKIKAPPSHEGEVPSSRIADALRFMMDGYDRIAAPISRAAIATMKERFSESSVRALWHAAQPEIIRPVPTSSSPEGAKHGGRLVRTLLRLREHASGSPSGAH